MRAKPTGHRRDYFEQLRATVFLPMRTHRCHTSSPRTAASYAGAATSATASATSPAARAALPEPQQPQEREIIHVRRYASL